MPRQFTDSIQPPAETHGRIASATFRVVYDQTTGNATAASFLLYTAEVIDANGTVVRTIAQRIPWPSIPTTHQTEIRSIFSAIMAHAEANGVFPAGTDTGDL